MELLAMLSFALLLYVVPILFVASYILFFFRRRRNGTPLKRQLSTLVIPAGILSHQYLLGWILFNLGEITGMEKTFHPIGVLLPISLAIVAIVYYVRNTIAPESSNANERNFWRSAGLEGTAVAMIADVYVLAVSYLFWTSHA